MKNSICALVTFASAARVDAFKAASMPHPFVGEHHASDIIEHERGSTHRVTPVKSFSDKYASIKSNMSVV